MTGATYPECIPSRTSSGKRLDSGRGRSFAPSKQEENGDDMKLWKCDAMGPVEGVMVMQVVVMAETRQQAIEKASAKLSAKLPGMLGQMFPEDGDRRFAQLRPDILDNMEEAPEEVTIAVVAHPVLEDDTGAPHTGSPSV